MVRRGTGAGRDFAVAAATAAAVVLEGTATRRL
jgi:hypothetical protein